MTSLKYPNMFRVNSSEVWTAAEYKEATLQNISLTLRSFRNELLGDPYFGNTLNRYLFEQNDVILKDIIIDTIYPQLVAFIPQLKIDRKDITIIQDRKKGQLIMRFKGRSQIDYQLYTYSTVLLTSSDY
jgi:hypothetical protein